MGTFSSPSLGNLLKFFLLLANADTSCMPKSKPIPITATSLCVKGALDSSA